MIFSHKPQIFSSAKTNLLDAAPFVSSDVFYHFLYRCIANQNTEMPFRRYNEHFIRTLVEVWKNSKKLWKHSAVGLSSHSISISPRTSTSVSTSK